MEATHIIKPEGFDSVYLTELIPSKDFIDDHPHISPDTVYWVDSRRDIRHWPLGGPHCQTEDEAIESWNAMFSKAPRTFDPVESKGGEL